MSKLSKLLCPLFSPQTCRALSWRAGTQAIVAHSSTEAELISLDEACRELGCLRAMLADLRIPVQLPVEIAQDNM